MKNRSFPKIKNATSGQSCETQVLSTQFNSDYLEMLIKIDYTEELPSAKSTTLGVYPQIPTACQRTVENSSCEGLLGV